MHTKSEAKKQVGLTVFFMLFSQLILMLSAFIREGEAGLVILPFACLIVNSMAFIIARWYVIQAYSKRAWNTGLFFALPSLAIGLFGLYVTIDWYGVYF